MSPRTEIALVLIPWVAFVCGLLAFCTWRDTRPATAIGQTAPLIR